MKCSKCGYLGFETGDRCRNCGYQFSFADSGELPLFISPLDDDTPLITKPSPPRAPLAVRRSTPDLARMRPASTSTARAVVGDLALDLQPRPTPEVAAVRPTPATRPSNTPEHRQDAGVARRVAAGTIDLLLLLAVDLVVVYFTMQICGVALEELALLPKGPLVVFLLVQNVGYLVAFTVGGQTLGKMAAGIKVVAGDCDAAVDVPRALKRTVMSLLLAVPGGLGLLPTLFDKEHRGLHDRFAGTRVVRATA
jgi:uncharacterized RDD family membrane protein YckC